MFINGSPPPLVNLRAGETILIPLQRNENPTTEPWTLLGVEGVGLTVPVRSVLDESFGAPQGAHQFILREIANSLCFGSAAEMSAAGGYVHDEFQNLAPEVMPLLTKGLSGPMSGNGLACWSTLWAFSLPA